jgi:uncharacterized membrane protein
MAGIGFELKKLFAQKGIVLQLRANLYASMIVAGPMLMGALLLLGMKWIAVRGGATPHQQDVIIVVTTYSLLFSLLTTSIFLFVLARYIADMLYVQKEERILPSMYGSIALLLTIGGIGWAIFLYLSKLDLVYSLLSFFLFCQGIVVWIQINYITAVKDYSSIFKGFLVGIIAGLSVGFLLVWLDFDIIASLQFGACLTYAILIFNFTNVLHKFFPMGSGSSFKFLEWIDEYPPLPFVGFFTTLGLFIHLMLMWSSPWGTQVEGYFYHAPSHDIPALLAFLTSLTSSVNFVTSVEINFYPKYRIYFGLLNGDGSLFNIEKAYDEMMSVLKQELFYLALQQIFVTILAIVVVGEILVYFNLGFSLVMIGLFRILCIGYGLFAVGNSMMLFLLYFANNRDAMWSAAALLAVNTIATMYVNTLPEVYYGFGFVLAGMAFYISTLIFLWSYTRKLDFYTFSKQPIFFIEKRGFFRPLVRRLESQENKANQI